MLILVLGTDAVRKWVVLPSLQKIILPSLSGRKSEVLWDGCFFGCRWINQSNSTTSRQQADLANHPHYNGRVIEINRHQRWLSSAWCCDVQSGKNWTPFQRGSLPPLSRRSTCGIKNSRFYCPPLITLPPLLVLVVLFVFSKNVPKILKRSHFSLTTRSNPNYESSFCGVYILINQWQPCNLQSAHIPRIIWELVNERTRIFS